MLILVVGLFSFRLWQTTGCRQFNGFYFNPISVKINVESQSSIDTTTERQIIRFFHNKAVTAPYEVSKSFARTLDTRFLLDVLGPAGILFLISGLFEIFRYKRKIGFIHLLTAVAILLFSITAILTPKSFFTLIALSYYSLCLWGVAPLSKDKRIGFVSIVLIFYSLWYFAINWQMSKICNDIFFH
ncbi:MAG: hypothetical protein WD988_00850 [Candidatus Curtissbacteria bacterium]